MDSNSARYRIFQSLKRNFKRWLGGSVLALIVILALYTLIVNWTGICRATVHFKYDGVEYGFDPNGIRFDPADLKSAELLRRTSETLGEPLNEEELERIQNALEIRGTVNSETLDAILENQSVYGNNEILATTDVRADSYFPTEYEIVFRYKDAGFGATKASAYLTELLKTYESYFYDCYGYNTSLAQVISSIDYEQYDYIDAVEIFQNHLSSLRSYLSRLENQDNTRFVSSQTGYSFSDLIGTIDTLRAEDIQWVSSYITSNNITKDRGELIDYYRYKIEDAERVLVQQDSRLYTLNGLIENYVKTTAVFPIVGDAGTSPDGSDNTYEFSQPSQMYDTLINDKIACQTDLSQTREEITMLQERVERLQSTESTGSPALVEERLSLVKQKIDQLLENITLTADEFFKTVWLKDAVQIVSTPHVSTIAIARTVRQSLPALLIVEAVLFGLYVLSTVRVAFRRDDVIETSQRPESATDCAGKEKVPG